MKKIHHALKLIAVLFASVMLHTATQAQSLYRCGSSYQDRPCDGVQKGGKLVGGTSGSAAANGAVSDASCVQRGADAQKIVWAREGGAMRDQQLAKAGSASEQKLINDVYARRGTSSDIRAAIEADCIAEKEKAAQVAALLEAARTGQSPAAPVAPGGAQNKANEAEQKAEAASARDNTAREEANKKIRCNYLKSLQETVFSKQRAGGDAKTMEDLKQQKQDIERRLNTEKCG